MRDRPNRSDHYQWVINEVLVTDTYLESFTNQHSISNLLNPYQYSEEYLQLKDELKKEFWKLVEEVCTERQKVILKMYAEGKTQTEMAIILNVNQSSITKSINGNLDYTKGGKTYGGVIKKLKKHTKENEKIQGILDRMQELLDEKW